MTAENPFESHPISPYSSGNVVPTMGPPPIVEHRSLYLDALTTNEAVKTYERQSLAVDAYNIGRLAVGTELYTATTVGGPIEIDLPTPFERKDLRRKLGIDLVEGKFGTTVPKRTQSLDRTLKVELKLASEVKTESAATEYIEARTSEFDSFLSKHTGRENQEFTFKNLTIPSVLRNAKERDGLTKSWVAWLAKGATKSQKENFAQWYNSEVVSLSNPETRQQTVEAMKQNYSNKVGQAMAEGWIDTKHQKHLERTVKKAKVNFFSPFSQTADSFGGANYTSLFENNSIVLPIGANQEVTVHEFGHSFAGVNMPAFEKSLGLVGDKGIAFDLRTTKARDALFTTLNEGYNEHMAQALLHGSPEIVNPELRSERGLESDTASKDYAAFRHVYGVLLGGPEGEGTVNKDDLTYVISTMVEGDISGFDEFLTNKWGGRPILKELYEATMEMFSQSSTWSGAIYADKLIATLQGQGVLEENRQVV
ncbi:MAG: hypothetical protein ABI602_05005 [Candidatus Saccharibacteria bacterium]